jgi:UPF0271 protein
MKSFKVNCDVGEGVHNEVELMPYIDQCNIACGGHAGDCKSMAEIIDLAIKHDVLIGAHPSYPDKDNFGRKSILISDDELIKSIRKQINDLIEITINKNTSLYHIKAHGALYNDIAKNSNLATTFLKAITPYKLSLKLFVPYGSVIEKEALKNDFSIIYEAFADRNYNDDLTLVSRDHKNALVANLNDIIKHVNDIVLKAKVRTISNKMIFIKADTFCVHSDTKNAVKLVKGICEFIQN